MPTTFSMADTEVNDLLKKVVERWHPDLRDFSVKIGVLMAWNPDGPAVKAGGYPCYACVKPVPLKDQMSKGYEVELLIDGQAWDDMNVRHRTALLDHECSHLYVAKIGGSSMEPKLNDLDRPVVKTKNADWNAGDGFRDVVRRHGRYAIEHLNLGKARAIVEGAEQDHNADAANRPGGSE